MGSLAAVDDDLIGVTIDTAARVVGVSVRRLIDWDVHDLVKPSIRQKVGARTIRLYGFVDLVQGKVVRQLESRNVNVRSIARIVRILRQHGTKQPLAELRWYVDGTRVSVELPTGELIGDRHMNQAMLRGVVKLDEVRAETRAAIARPHDEGGKTEQRRGRMGRREVFLGTRLPVSTVVDYVRAGYSDERIMRSFPVLGKADVAMARRRAAEPA